MNRQPRLLSRQPATALIKRSFALLICQLLVLQPLVASAATIAQQPMFTVSSAPANVMLMMDDSSSMAGYRLPTPPSLTVPGGNVAVKYGAGMRSVSARDELQLRAPAFNPLWYNPSIEYKPWNDNNKPMPAPGTSYPVLAQNFPNADIGGTSNVMDVATLTQRDMRYRTPGSRDWISQARGTVGSTNAYAAYAPAVSQWRYEPNTPNTPRWENDLLPSGVSLYPLMPAEGEQGADLFTNPQTTTCSSGPPCTQYNPTFTQQCSATAQVYTGDICVQYAQQQQGTVQQCTTYAQQQIGTQQVCTSYSMVQNGQTCTRYDTILVPDATEETGFRQEVVCGQYTPTYAQVCDGYTTEPVFGPVCTAYIDVPNLVNVCVQMQPQYQTQCTAYTQVQSGQTCVAYDPNWTCPPQDVVVTQDGLTPARYLRYEGGDPSTAANYRIIEIDRARGWTGASRNYAVAANRYDTIDAATGAAATRPDCNAPPFGTGLVGQDGSWCTFEQEAQNFANFYAYYKNRGSAAVAVTSQALASLVTTDQFLRIGFGRINYFSKGPQAWNVTDNNDRLPNNLPNLDGASNDPGAVQRGVREFAVGSQDRADLFHWLFSLNWVGSTPNREAIDAAGQYFARSDARGPWADIPGTTAGRTPANHLWCRRNYTLLATDGEWTKVDPGTSPEPQPLITKGNPNRPGGGNVLKSDGAMGPAMTGTDKVTGGPLTYQYDPAAPAEQSYALGSAVSQDETLSDVIHYYWSHDLRDSSNVPLRNSLDRLPATASRAANPAFWQHMSTFIVGYGVSGSMDISANRTAVATGAAVTWPDVGMEKCRITDNDPACTSGVPGNRINDTMRGALMSRGDFYAAASPQQLRQSILDALQQILAENASGSALAVSSSSASAGNLVIQAGFRTDVWDGSVRAVDALELVNYLRGGPQPSTKWDAKFPAAVDRNILTSIARNTAVPFAWGSISAAQQTQLGNQLVLDYLRGDPANELRAPYNGTFRNRRDSILGDIVNSTPLYSVNANWMYHLNPNAVRNTGPQPASTYRAYVTNKKYNLANNTGRVPTVLVGANDGMLHAFDARAQIHATDVGAGYEPGKELFAYVPRGVYANLSSLSTSTYNSSHRYFVDGQVVEGDVHFGGGGSWQTVAVGTAGAGARNVFALDVTDPKAFNASKVLWDVTQAEEPDLGHVLGTGVIGSVRDQTATNLKGRWVYMTGNGYESANNRAVLLLFDMQSGAVIKRFDTLVGDATTPNGLGPVTPVYDGSRNIVAAYGGDKLGNMWRFDMGDNNPSNWTIRKVFQARDPSSNPQPITTAPRVVLHPLGGFYVLFGTGKFFESGDQSDLQVHSVYGLWDRGGTGTIPKTGLGGLAQLTLSNAGTGLRQLDVSGLNWSGNIGGWYFDMQVGAANGERVIASPIMVGGLLQVTSFAPTSQGDPCIPGGISYIYRLDLASSFNQSVFMNQLPNVVGLLQSPGSVAGAGVFFIGADPGAMVASETAADQAVHFGKAGVSAATNARAPESGTCTDVIAFSGVSGNLGGVQAVCQQYLPMRLFRPLR